MTIKKNLLSAVLSFSMIMNLVSFHLPTYADNITEDDGVNSSESFVVDIYEAIRNQTNIYYSNTGLEEGVVGNQKPIGEWADANSSSSKHVSGVVTTAQAYNGNNSYLNAYKGTDRVARAYAPIVYTAALRANTTYVGSVMAIGTELNSTNSEVNANDLFYLRAVTNGSVTRLTEYGKVPIKDLAQAPASTDAVQKKVDKSDWTMFYHAITISSVPGYLGFGLYSQVPGTEAYTDDYYMGELIVANMDVTADKTTVYIPESGSEIVSLTATAYNQLGNTNFLALNEQSPYIYTIVTAPSGVTVSDDGIITVPADSKVGKIEVKVTANPTFLGADTQTDAQKALREKIVEIDVEAAPGASTAPKAKNVSLENDVTLNSELKLKYEYWNIFDDGNGGEYSEDKDKTMATIIWYKGETVIGPWTAFNEGKDSYKIETEDAAELFYKAEITPVSKNGEEGETVETEPCGKPVPPVASNVRVSGVQALGEEWTVSYDYSDANNDAKRETKYQWYIADSADIDVEKEENRVKIEGADSDKIKLDDEEYALKYIYVSVIPVSEGDLETTGKPVYSKPRLTSAVPRVTGVKVKKYIASLIEVEYNYSHPLGIEEGETIIEWYNGSEQVGKGSTIDISALKGKKIEVRITPVAEKKPDKGKTESVEYTVPKASSTSVGGGGVSGGGSVVKPADKPAMQNVPSWAKSEIDFVLENKIMEVAAENDFGGSNQINRGEFMMAMLKAAGIAPSDYRGSFADVTALDKFSGYLQAAYDQGVISGADNFYPARELTRDEMCKIIVTSIEAMTKKEIGKASITQFTDYSNIQSWAIDYISQAVSTGIIVGNADGSVNPKGNVTRAEAAVIAKRIVDYVKAEGGLK